MTRIGRKLLLSLLVTSFAFAYPALASDVTINGTVNFSALDGSADDADHTVNGVFTVNGNLTVNGTINCNDGGGNVGACPMQFVVTGDVVLASGSAIFAEDRSTSGNGGDITITAGGNFTMQGTTTSLAGAIISSSKTNSGTSFHAGNITISAANVTQQAGAIIAANANDCAAGAISITGSGSATIGGLVLAGPSRSISTSTIYTGIIMSGGGGHVVGGPISIVAQTHVEPALTIASTAIIAAQGGDVGTSGGHTVTLEACGIRIYGLVASLARRNTGPRVAIRSGSTIVVDGSTLDTTGSAFRGRLRADATTESADGYHVDLFASKGISITGPAATSSQFAVTSNAGSSPSRFAGTINVSSLNETVTATGNAFQVTGNQGGDQGGDVNVSAKNNVTLDSAVIDASGASSGSTRAGGDIAVRSYSGAISWVGGVGDVRPVGSSAGVPVSQQGTITLTSCTGTTTSGTSFPTNGSPVGTFPTQATACSPAAPSLPAGEPALPVCCNAIIITNPPNDSGTAGSPFSAQFTEAGAIGTFTYSLFSGSLPNGLTLSSSGLVSGTPTVVGAYPIVVQVTDSQGCTGTSSTYTIHIACQTITVTNPAVSNGTAGTPFSQTFTQSGAIGSATFSTSSVLPAGLTLSAGGVLSGTPTQTGTFPIVVTVTDSNGCSGNGPTYNLVIHCQTITVTNPANNSGTVNTAFSATFTQSGAIGGATFSTSSTLPTGIALSSGGVLSGTPTQTGSFPIVVTVTDGNGCTGSGPTYTLTISCQTITVTNPAANSATVNSPFSATFTASNTVGTTTFTTASALPAGIALAANGTLSGTPTQTGSFPIVVTATDSNGCSGSGPTYTLTVACQVITVNNPANSTGTAGSPFSATFTASNTVGATTFTTASALPSGITLSSGGVLSGTPTVVGTFPIVVTATDANGCSGSGPTYNLVINCQTITVNAPPNNAAVAGSPFSATFTASNTIGATTFSETGALPSGVSFTSGGVLSGTPMQTGSFPIVVTATDSNGCQGSAGYTLVVACQTITVTNPAVNTGTANSPFSQTFTASNTIGTTTFSTASALPTGMTLSTSGVLSGTPTVVGTFPIVVTATDSNGCSGSGPTYNLTISCQTITVNNPPQTTGTVNAPFSVQFTASNTIGTTTFSTSSTLPAGLSFASNGTLSGTPMQPGTFPIVVTATDGNGCTGTSSTYNLVINCQVITVTNPANNNGTVGVPFSEQFTQNGALGTATFSTSSTLPTGLTLSTSGLLSGTPTQSGTFNITVTVTDSNGCTGSSVYNLTIACNTISVTNPAQSTFTAGQSFSVTFTQSGGNGTVTWSESGALPSGVTLNSATGVLSGATSQTGSFPITVTATDANGCSGSSNYTLTITCNSITITNPSTNSGTAGQPFSAQFTASGLLGGGTWSETGVLPTGITLSTSGLLSGTTSQTGTFPITVKVTDTNGCFATSSYTLTIACQTITVTNPAVTTGTAGVPFSQTFTATGILGTATWSTASTLPTGMTLNASTGVLSGTPTQSGTFPIVATVTDSNGCSGSGPTYTLVIACPTITVSRTGGGSFPAATFGSPYGGQSFTATGSSGTPYTFAVTGGTFPSGLAVASSGAISGTPTATGTFTFTVTATDAYGCSGSQSFSIAVRPSAGNDSYATLVNNTQAYISGGLTATPSTPAVAFSTKITANDAPAGGVTLSSGTFATTAGGSVTVASDGTFLYTPPLAFVTSDSFSYTITSDTGGTGTPTTATATVTFTLANRVWYINPTAGINGNGRSQSPWNNTSSIAGTLASDILFVYNNGGVTTNTNAKITLLANQQLIGQGVTLIVNGFTLVTATSAPTLTATANDVVAINNGNTIAGVVLTNATNNLIAGTNPASLTVSNATLTPSGIANGFNLSGATGTITVSNVTMTGTSTGNMVNVVGGSGNWTFISSPMTQTSGRALNVTSKTSGSMSWDAASPITVSAGTTDGAISLTGNSGATFNFNGKLAITVSGTARGIVLSSSGTVNGTDATSTIATADSVVPCGGGNCSAAIDATGTTLGMTFRSINVNGSHGNVPIGASFNATAGSFSVVGDGSGFANGTGGTISGTTSRPVYLIGAGGTYTFKSMNSTMSSTSVNGWLADYNAGNATATLNVTGDTFTGANSSSQNKALLQVEAGSTSNVTLDVQDSFFNNSVTYGLFAVGQGSSTLSVTVNQSGFGTNVNSGTPINNPGTTITTPNALGMSVGDSGSAVVTYNVTNNTYWGTDGLRGATYAVAFNGGANTAAAQLTGTFSGNKIGKAGVLSSGCANGCAGLGLLPGTAGTFKVTMQNNDIRQVNAVNVDFRNTAGVSTATMIGHISNNTFAEPDTTGGPTLRALTVSPGNSAGSSVAACVEITGNTIVGPGWTAGSWIRITNANNTIAMILPGLTPTTGATSTQVSAFVESQNTFSGGSGTDVLTTVGTAGINGGSPCP